MIRVLRTRSGAGSRCSQAEVPLSQEKLGSRSVGVDGVAGSAPEQGADALRRSSAGEAVAGSAFGKSLREAVRSVGVDGVAIGS